MGDFAARTFIYSVLAGDAALSAIVGTRIFDTQPPSDAPLPYVVFQEYTTDDVLGVGAIRLWTMDLWLVRGFVRQMSFGGNSKTIADRIDAVLHRADHVNANGTVWACTRERRLSMVETTDAGDQVRHLGGIYRIMAT